MTPTCEHDWTHVQNKHNTSNEQPFEHWGEKTAVFICPYCEQTKHIKI